MSVMRKCSWFLFVALVGSSFAYPQAAKNSSEQGPGAARLKTHPSVEVQKGSKASPKPAGLNSVKKLQLISVGIADPKSMPESLPLMGQSLGLRASTASAKGQPGRSSADPGVSEFQAVSHDFGGSSGALVVPSSGSGKSALKDIHGEVDGALAPGSVGGNQIGGAVGATSKNGKTSIFIQTNHATVQEPH
jgi:hypothetical protein